jgi:hypothetical protein
LIGSVHLQVLPWQWKPVNWRQSSQLGPQLLSVEVMQAPPLPQALKPLKQRTSHEPPLQTGKAFGSLVVQGEQLVPQVLTLLLETQVPPQSWNPLTQPVNAQVPVAVLQTPVPLVKAWVQSVRAAPQTVLVLASHPPLKR